MQRLYQPLLFLLARSTADDLQRQVEYLKAENEMLRKRVPKKRLFLRSDERAHLLKLGKGLGPAIRHLITIVDYSTYRRWVRKEEPRAVRPRKGRPRIMQVIREVILIMKDVMMGWNSKGVALELDWEHGPAWGSLEEIKVDDEGEVENLGSLPPVWAEAA